MSKTGLVGGYLGLAGALSNGIPMTVATRPSWHKAAGEVCARSGVVPSSLALVLVQNPFPNAYALWALNGRAIVITSGLADILEGDDAAQRFVLGHELGHLLFHQPWHGIVRALFALPTILGVGARLFGLGWVRAAERSADRLGVVLSGSPLAAARVLLALSMGTRLADEDVRATLRSLPHRPGGLWGYAAESLADHPFLRPRLEALFSYTGGRLFPHLVGRELAEAARWELSALGMRPDIQGGCVWPKHT